MTTSLGDRIKLYERAHDVHFTPNSPVIVRVDGKAFHTYLRGAERPFDQPFMDAMVEAARLTSRDMQGFKLAYTQSDECTFLVTDYDSHETQGWFDYSLNKIISITASMFTAYFNLVYRSEVPGIFDARAFLVPIADAPNVFVWRQRDWERNSVQMLARSVFSHRECYGKKIPDMHEMLHERGINWADLDMREKNGTFITRDGALITLKLTYENIYGLLNPERKEEVETPKPLDPRVLGSI